MWTLDELVEKVREALAAEYPGAPNGRVRDVPDRRAIRWYTTIGLVDKPLGMRGRSALYGPRHLEQLVAIKRLQAQGRSLSQIQVDFTWITPSGLSDLAQVPVALLADDAAFGLAANEIERPRFWADHPTSSAPPNGVRDEETTVASAPHVPRSVSGVALGGGVLLLVPHEMSDRDRLDIAAAAAPLIDLLQARGLTDGSSS